MLKKILFVALCVSTSQVVATPKLETGAVVCDSAGSIRQAYAVATTNPRDARMPSRCAKTRSAVSLVSSSVLGQLARIEVVANGNVEQMWTLPLYIRD